MVEFDLETMLNGEHFADFAILYRLAHRSRLPHGMDDSSECLLEEYYQQGIEQGGRVRDRLRDGVEQAIRIMGDGFLAHPDNHDLRHNLENGNLKPLEYYRQLLRLIYRLLFLLTSEERHLIGSDNTRLNKIYYENYSLSRFAPIGGSQPTPQPSITVICGKGSSRPSAFTKTRALLNASGWGLWMVICLDRRQSAT